MRWTGSGREPAMRALARAGRLLVHPAGAGVAIALLLAAFVVVPYLELLQTTKATTQRRADLLAEQAGLRVQTYLTSTIHAIAALSAREPAATFESRSAFSSFAADIHRAFPGIVAVNWVDTGYTINWVYPVEENRPAQGASLADHPRAGPIIREADHSGRPQMTPGLNLLQGGSGFAVYIPRVEEGRRVGFVNLALRDTELLETVFPSWEASESMLVIANDHREVFAMGYVPAGAQQIESVYEIPILNQTWRSRVVLVVPRFTLNTILVIGMALAAGIGLAVAELLRRRLRSLEAERRLAAVGENAPAMISQCVLWPDGRFTFPYVSRGIERLLGPAATPGRMKEDPGFFWNRIVPEDVDRIRESLRRSAESMAPWEEEFRVTRDDGKVIWLSGSARPYRDARRNAVWDGILVEVTERKEAELALARSEEQLRLLQRMESIGQLTGGIAHDFNNMLMIILGNLDLAVDRLRDDPKTRDAILLAIGAAERGAELTRHLLAFARKQSLMPRPINANELVRQVGRIMRRVLGENVDVELDLAEAPWDAFCDPAQLEGALVNLAVNARDAMPRGGRLTLATENRVLDETFTQAHPDVAAGEYVAISVADTGVGMSPDIVRRVFEPFFTTKEVGKGTGLGLAMVYGFVKQSGGHVTIESEPGRGSVLTLFVPRARADSSSKDAA